MLPILPVHARENGIFPDKMVIVRDVIWCHMAHCPTCEGKIEYVIPEVIEIRGADTIDAEYADGGRAVATVCPHCEAIIGI